MGINNNFVVQLIIESGDRMDFRSSCYLPTICITLFNLASSLATTILPLSFTELSKQSNFIVEATVEHQAP